MSDKYILDGKTPVRANDLTQWASWYEKADEVRRVAWTTIGDTDVSTVFLGLDHSFGDGPPLLFETMIFNHPELEDYQERYTTWEEAEAGHARAVRKVEGA